MRTKALCNHPYVFHPASCKDAEPAAAQRNRVQIGSTIAYKGRRCQVIAYQPPGTTLAACWPEGRSYRGLAMNGRVAKYRMDHPPKEGRYILAAKRCNEVGEELAPHYFFARYKDLG
jgi:hypothetical protein